MTAPDSILEAQTAALLRRLAREQESRVRKLRSEAEEQSREIQRRARSEARARIKQVVVDTRRETDTGVALRRAALDTQSRRSRQATLRQLLERAWQRLPEALAARWQEPAARAEWCRAACRQALRSLRETQAIRVELDAGRAAEMEPLLQAELHALGAGAVAIAAVPDFGPGLRIHGGMACLDATLTGLLASRDRVAAELLAQFAGLETAPAAGATSS